MNNDAKIKEFETKLSVYLEDIQRLYKRYNPDGKYMSLVYVNGHWNYNNEYWANDQHFPIDGHT